LADPSPAPLLLTVRHLKVHFRLRNPGSRRASQIVRAVDDVTFSIRRGTTFGLVGESGSGKTTTALAVMRLLTPSSGQIFLEGADIAQLPPRDLRLLRRNFQMVFQDPYSSLDPRRRVGDIVREPLDRLAIGSRRERSERVRALLSYVGLSSDQAQLFPHQFSGGQRQRIGIARALSPNPKLVVCDEPVSALDVAVRSQILNLLLRLQKEFGLAYLFISHDLGVVQHMCDEVAVMYLGRVVEHADRVSLFATPRHPYTKALLSAVPSLDSVDGMHRQRIRLEGAPPSSVDPTPGCPFHPRCPIAEERCKIEEPVLRSLRDGHWVRCHLA
jgi:peptide/nickel transport system ATP-binding protein